MASKYRSGLITTSTSFFVLMFKLLSKTWRISLPLFTCYWVTRCWVGVLQCSCETLSWAPRGTKYVTLYSCHNQGLDGFPSFLLRSCRTSPALPQQIRPQHTCPRQTENYEWGWVKELSHRLVREWHVCGERKRLLPYPPLFSVPQDEAGMTHRKKACSVLQLVIYLGSGLDHHPYLCLSKQNRRYLKYDDRKRQVPSEAAGPHTIHGGKGSVSFLRSSGHWIKWLGLRQTAGSHIRELLTGWGNFIPRTFFHSAYKFTNHLLCPQHYASFLE